MNRLPSGAMDIGRLDNVVGNGEGRKGFGPKSSESDSFGPRSTGEVLESEVKTSVVEVKLPCCASSPRGRGMVSGVLGPICP